MTTTTTTVRTTRWLSSSIAVQRSRTISVIQSSKRDILYSPFSLKAHIHSAYCLCLCSPSFLFHLVMYQSLHRIFDKSNAAFLPSLASYFSWTCGGYFQLLLLSLLFAIMHHIDPISKLHKASCKLWKSRVIICCNGQLYMLTRLTKRVLSCPFFLILIQVKRFCIESTYEAAMLWCSIMVQSHGECTNIIVFLVVALYFGLLHQDSFSICVLFTFTWQVDKSKVWVGLMTRTHNIAWPAYT